MTERPLSIDVGGRVVLEGALALPTNPAAGVVVCHPHPLYGGDMDSPVVLAVVEACAEAGLATLRFNFRGVGGSTGAWDDGRGEQEDVRAAVRTLRQRLPPERSRVALAGYSFGAAMAAAVADSGERLDGLALIAPPLAVHPGVLRAPSGVDGPVLVAAGSDDHYCPAEGLATFARALPAATVTVIDGADHFFLTGLPQLSAALSAWAGTLTRRTSAGDAGASRSRPTG
jgi:alpha/beta superfamily hydrolase